MGGHKERRGSARAIAVHRALDGDLGHAKGAADLALAGAAVDHQLAGEQAVGGQVVLGVGEDGQVAVEVGDLPLATLEGQRLIQMRGASREQGQLHLCSGPR